MADILEAATLTGAIRSPAVWVMTGTHPSCGAFTTIQDDAEGVILHSQFPAEWALAGPTFARDGDLTLAACQAPA